MVDELWIRHGLSIPASDLEWQASRASGAGGQHVNTTSSKVELRFDLEGNTTLPAAVKERLRRLAAARLDGDGRILLVCQDERSQFRNKSIALERLRVLIQQALVAPKKRRATRPTRASVRRRLESKRAQSEKKKSRRTASGRGED